MEIRPSIPLNVGEPRYVDIYVVGCGGTGSYLSQRLARLAGHCREMGIEVNLTLVDHDRVEPKNLWRQLFVAPEVGQHKAEALAVRYARGFGLPIRFYNERIRAGHINAASRYRDGWLRLVVGCVDTTGARCDIENIVRGWSGRLWWLDCGNDHHNGQVILGNRGDIEGPEVSPLGYCTALPLPSVVAPELVEGQDPPEGEGGHCADDAAANVQGLMVNEAVASFAAHYIYRMVVLRDLDMSATYFNLQAGNARSEYITKPQHFLPAPRQAAVTGIIPPEVEALV